MYCHSHGSGRPKGSASAGSAFSWRAATACTNRMPGSRETPAANAAASPDARTCTTFRAGGG